MKRSGLVLLFVVTFLGFCPLSLSAPCRTLDWARVENQKDLDRLKDVCVINSSLAIFTRDIRQITLPDLKKVGLINIDSDGLEAIAFPSLESARDLYMTSSDLKIAEFPQLREVSSRLVVNQTSVSFLNFSQLSRVGRLIIQNCPKLEFVFSESLLPPGSIWLENNPSLSEVCESRLLADTQAISVAEMTLLQENNRKMATFKRLYHRDAIAAPIRPTGHKTQFDSFGMIVNHYYNWYPYEYSRYVGYIGPWGYSWIYWL
jgi:hypothetical protein